MAEIWLNIPQAVVLEATGDLKLARGLEGHDPHLLLIKAAWLLPPIVSVSVDAGANDAEARRALHSRMAELDLQTARVGYEKDLQRVRDKLIDGVTAKGSRAPHMPLEIIDPAEFVRLELRNLDAVDPMTGKKVWYGLLISARELSENGSQPSSCELHQRRRDQADGTAQIGLSTRHAPPLSDRDLRLWYENRVLELTAKGEVASGEADWAAAKDQFSGRVTRVRLRAMRDEFAPLDWKKQGRRSRTVK